MMRQTSCSSVFLFVYRQRGQEGRITKLKENKKFFFFFFFFCFFFCFCSCLQGWTAFHFFETRHHAVLQFVEFIEFIHFIHIQFVEFIHFIEFMHIQFFHFCLDVQKGKKKHVETPA